VRRSDGREETITRLQDYQEEAVAQRVRSGLIQGRAIYLDDYVNAVFRREPIARAKHGTRYMVCKAFRRHLAQDVDTGHALTCPPGPSNVTPPPTPQTVGSNRSCSGFRPVLSGCPSWQCPTCAS